MKDISKEYIKELIDRYIPLILDIGCYDGKDSKELSMLYQYSEVHCFECDPRSINIYKQVGDLPGVFLHPIALCNHDGEVELNLSYSDTRRHRHHPEDWSASSSLKDPKKHIELFPDVQFHGKIEVPCMKLDSWREDTLPGRTIDFIWCDVNGAEADVIMGGLETLNKHTRYLYIEVSDKELYEGQPAPDEILKMLPGFEFMKLYNYQGNFGNILLKNKKL